MITHILRPVPTGKVLGDRKARIVHKTRAAQQATLECGG
jgi:hypothetical protein